MKAFRDALMKAWYRVLIFSVKLKLQSRRARRLMKRFIKRFREIWYITVFFGLLVLVLITMANQLNAYDSMKGYISGIINIAFTVYAVDFLRTEYERSQQANQRYLADVYLSSAAYSALFDFEKLVLGRIPVNGITLNKMTEEEIQERILTDSFMNGNHEKSTLRRQEFERIIKEAHGQISRCLFAGFTSYVQYRLAMKALDFLESSRIRDLLTDGKFPNDSWEFWLLARDVKSMFETLFTLNERNNYWWKDNDLEDTIRKLNKKIHSLSANPQPENALD